MKTNPTCVCGHTKSAHFPRYDGESGRTTYGKPCFGENDQAGECACECFMRAKAQPKPPKVPCGCCRQGVFRKSPGKDAYVCSPPKGGTACQRHISGEEFRRLAGKGRD